MSEPAASSGDKNIVADSPAFLPLLAENVPPRTQASFYPPRFAQRMIGRVKRPLGDCFGLKSFGVNLTRLEPGAQSALKHQHSAQDEFVYLVAGTAVLIIDDAEHELTAGMCAGFPAGGPSHHLVNRSSETVVYLEVGDRNPADEVFYPDDDLQVRAGPDGRRHFESKDGQPY